MSCFNSRLKAGTDGDSLILSLILFHVEDALYVKECKPYVIVDASGKVNKFFILKSRLKVFTVNMDLMNLGQCPLIALKSLRDNVRRFFWWTVTWFPLDNSC